jgi:hypothetical protein
MDPGPGEKVPTSMSPGVETSKLPKRCNPLTAPQVFPTPLYPASQKLAKPYEPSPRIFKLCASMVSIEMSRHKCHFRILLRGEGGWACEKIYGFLYFRVLLHFYDQLFWSFLRGYMMCPLSPTCVHLWVETTKKLFQNVDTFIESLSRSRSEPFFAV